MKTTKFAFVFLAAGLMSFTSCKESVENTDTQTAQNTHTEMHASTPESNQEAQISYQFGDVVPSDQVCMVNNAFMGTEQLIVEHDGKTYYGCCEMCQNRIPNDSSVRVAIDPISKKEIDKSVAVIAITGQKGEVSYFENEDNAKKYVESLN